MKKNVHVYWIDLDLIQFIKDLHKSTLCIKLGEKKTEVELISSRKCVFKNIRPYKYNFKHRFFF